VAEARVASTLHRDTENKDIQYVGNTAGTTTLDESTAADDSGAFLIGAFDEFGNSDSTNVQDVLDDLDASITAAAVAQNLFETFDVPSGTNPVADSPTDTLQFLEGSGLSITGNAGADSITVGIANGGVTETQLHTSVAGDGLSGGGGWAEWRRRQCAGGGCGNGHYGQCQ